MEAKEAIELYYESKPSEVTELNHPDESRSELKGDWWYIYNANGQLAKVHCETRQVVYGSDAEHAIRIEIEDQIAICNITDLRRDGCPVAIKDSLPIIAATGESLYAQLNWQYLALAVAELLGDCDTESYIATAIETSGMAYERQV